MILFLFNTDTQNCGEANNRIAIFINIILRRPETVAERSKAFTVFARSGAGIVGSIYIQAWMFGVCMRLLWVCVVFR
jgi:hypothetical protein